MSVATRERTGTPSAPLPVVTAAVTAGGVAGALLVGLQPGLNWLLTAGAVAAAVAVAWRRQVSRHLLVFSGLSLALVATAVHTSAQWQLVVNLACAVGLASLAVAPGRTWTEVLLGLTAIGWRAPGALAWLVRVHHRRPVRESAPGAFALMRGLLLGSVLLVVFGALFVSADEAFAQLAGRALEVPDISYGLLPARLVLAGSVAVFAAALASFAPALNVGDGGPISWTARVGAELGERNRRRLGRTEWVTALIMLDALFVVFVAVQVAVLFGGREHVLETSGLTYAQYARSGFFQLLVVAALTLLVLASLARYARREGMHDTLVLELLGGILVVLTMVVLASALKRLSLYEEVYGFTRLRLAVHATILWMVGLFVIVATAALATNARWMPRVVVVFSALAVLVFTLLRPDALIASRNVARFELTGKIDTSYLRALSPDAVPVLATLPEPERTCALVDLRAGLTEPESLWSFNLARDAAREVFSNTPESANALQTCPYR
ncbi:MAG: DUF4153 domain-containing protein [Actinomycetota bacterium]